MIDSKWRCKPLSTPKPMVLLASLSPAPSDLIWQNTYLSRSNRMFRAWSITIIIGLLTIFWSALLVPLAGLLSLGAIREVLPQLADALESNELTETFMTSVLPTLLVALLNVAVPYLYYCKFTVTLDFQSTLGLTYPRVCHLARHELAWRCRDVLHLQELLLRLLQFLPHLHRFRDNRKSQGSLRRF